MIDWLTGESEKGRTESGSERKSVQPVIDRGTEEPKDDGESSEGVPDTPAAKKSEPGGKKGKGRGSAKKTPQVIQLLPKLCHILILGY